MPRKTKESQSRRKKAPQTQAEAKPYKHPIPSANDLIDFLTDVGKPLKVEPILKAFELKGQRMRGLLIERLQTMVRAGQLLENRRGEYCLTAKLDLVTGTVSGHRDGFGFVRRDDGEPDDIYLSAREMRALFDGDRVAVRIKGLDRRGRAEGELVADAVDAQIMNFCGTPAFANGFDSFPCGIAVLETVNFHVNNKVL